MAGSIALAIHPASASPARSIDSAVSSAWLRQPSRRPTTRTTGSPSATARSTVSSDRSQRNAEPADALDDGEVRLARRGAGGPRRAGRARCRALRGRRRCAAPSASRSSTGVIVVERRRVERPAASASASVSSLAHAPPRATAPAATGFIGATRRPRARRACTSAQAATRLADAGVGAGHEHAAASSPGLRREARSPAGRRRGASAAPSTRARRPPPRSPGSTPSRRKRS